jgi:BlaI family transcriptional regulator, penicillinase repressor
MARPRSRHPTELEHELLRVLWQESPLRVSEIRARLGAEASRHLAHSSVITMLNIMVRKGYLSRRKEGKAFLFSAKVEERAVHGRMVRDLVGRIFGGSPAAMVSQLMETSDVDAEELSEIRRLIVRKSKEHKK